MALTTALDHSCSIGGARLQCWTITGNGSDTTVATNLKRIIAVWLQNIDDSDWGTGISTTTSAGTVTLYKAITNTKKWNLFVIGE